MKSKFSDSIYVMWHVQVVSRRSGEWVTKARFETRKDARTNCWMYREVNGGNGQRPYGFGNTRVVRVVAERKPRSMMTRPCAPGSYADPRTLHMPPKGKRGK